MQDFLLLLLLITPFVTAIAIALYNSQSPWSVLIVLIGAIAGAILIALSGIFWLQVWHRHWMESQAAGFIFVPILLPTCIYTGAVAGASLLAILSEHSGREFASPMFQMIAIGFTIVLSGLIPSGIIATSFYHSSDQKGLITLPVFAMLGGAASSWVASELAYLLVATLSRRTVG
jgi:hypothetical protein